MPLLLELARAAFDQILGQAVPSSFVDVHYKDRDAWQAAVTASNVRLQWDPDHDPHGRPVARRAVQLGLRRGVLAKYAREWIRNIEDVTPFVRAQHEALQRDGKSSLVTPLERVYPVTGANQLGVDVV
jgi:hypothetical protein